MFRWIAPLLLTIALISCDSDGGGGSGGAADARTVSGIVTGGSNVIVGAFSSEYWFMAQFSGEEDVVDNEWGDTTGSFTPLVSVTPEEGSYTIDLPADPEDMGELIAWADSNSNGKFDLGTEAGYFPCKEIEGTVRTIRGFGYITIGSAKYYLVCYDDDEGSQNSGFDIVGTGGFNFTID